MKKQLAVMLLCLFVSPVATAGVPSFVTYSGRLTDGTGWGESTTVNLTVRLYPCQCAFEDGCESPCPEDGDDSFWTGTHLNVPVSDGYFTVQLGRCDEVGTCTDDPGIWEFPTELPPQVWVEVIVDGAVLESRRPIGSVPFAVHAAQADQAYSVRNHACSTAACPDTSVTTVSVEKNLGPGAQDVVIARCPESHPIPLVGGCSSTTGNLEFQKSSPLGWSSPSLWGLPGTTNPGWICQYYNPLTAGTYQEIAYIVCRSK